MRQIKTVEATLNKEVVELYSDHYSCLIATVETDVASCLELFNKVREMGIYLTNNTNSLTTLTPLC